MVTEERDVLLMVREEILVAFRKLGVAATTADAALQSAIRNLGMDPRMSRAQMIEHCAKIAGIPESVLSAAIDGKDDE